MLPGFPSWVPLRIPRSGFRIRLGSCTILSVPLVAGYSCLHEISKYSDWPSVWGVRYSLSMIFGLTTAEAERIGKQDGRVSGRENPTGTVIGSVNGGAVPSGTADGKQRDQEWKATQ